jgi:hypothetical protein
MGKYLMSFFLKKISNLCLSVEIRVLYLQQIYHTNKQQGVANIKTSLEKALKFFTQTV